MSNSGYEIKTDSNGTKYWYLNGKLHREDGPAVEDSNGTKYWYLNGELHREDGPAVEYSNDSKRWYLNDKCYSEEDWKKKDNFNPKSSPDQSWLTVLEAALEAATPGPWASDLSDEGDLVTTGNGEMLIANCKAWYYPDKDARLISLLRNAAPELISATKERDILKTQVRELIDNLLDTHERNAREQDEHSVERANLVEKYEASIKILEEQATENGRILDNLRSVLMATLDLLESKS